MSAAEPVARICAAPQGRGVLRGLGAAALLATGYAVTGWLGLLLAIPPGYATAVWPPSGIALAGVLLLGNRASAGVALGSFLVNVATTLDMSSSAALGRSLAVAAAIGCGAALQALLGAQLIRVRVGFPTPLEREREVVEFLVLGAPVACLMNASLGSLTLWCAGLVAPEQLAFGFWTWWVGDSIGVLIFAPLLLIFAGGMQGCSGWAQRRTSVGVPLLASFALSVAVFGYVSDLDERRIRSDFEKRAEALRQAVASRLDSYTELLYSVEGLYAASQQVDRREFHKFAAYLLKRSSGLLALEWVPRVSRAERPALEAAVRAEGFEGFELKERDTSGALVRAGEREEFFPALLVEPQASNVPVLGYDLASEPMRRATLLRAQSSGRPAASPPLELVQSGAQRERGVLFALPYYGNSGSGGSAPVRPAATGFVVAVFTVRDLVDAMGRHLERPGILLQITDRTAGDEVREVYRDEDYARAASGRGGLASRALLQVGARSWELELRTTPEYIVAQITWARWLVLAGALALSSMLGAFLLVLTGRTSRIEQLVEARTAELERSNEELEQFAYVASHDLQEPLRMVASYTQLLAKRYQGKLGADADEFIGYAVDGAQRMRALIQDLLALSRVGSSGAALVPCELEHAYQWALENLRAAVAERSAEVAREPLPRVIGDQIQLGQLLQNLIANALKFCDEAQPRVQVSARREGAYWRISVQDNGIGIDPVHQEIIWVVFQRLHQRSEYPGTGIGLSICRKIVQRHGGEIGVVSDVGKGATFHFTLRAAAPL